MLTLIGTVLLALGFALFATQNTGNVSLNFGQYILPAVPVYLVVLIPLLVGLLAAFFIHLGKDLSSSLTISEGKDKISSLKKDLAEVTKKAHKLELENTKLKTEAGEPPDTDSI